jgi:hypothetical protein
MHKATCRAPPTPPALAAALAALDPAALSAALAAHPGPLAHLPALVPEAVAAYDRLAQEGGRQLQLRLRGAAAAAAAAAASAQKRTDYTLARSFARASGLATRQLLPVLRQLLARGAPAGGGGVPPLPRARPADCSAPAEVVLAWHHCDEALALLAGAGARLDGVCRGVAEGVCPGECSALVARLGAGLTLLYSLPHVRGTPQAAAVEGVLGETLPGPRELRALLRAGAGGAPLTRMHGAPLAPHQRTTALVQALMEAISALEAHTPRSGAALEVLLAAGASPDVTLWIPRGGAATPPLEENCLLHYLVEEACNEALGDGPSAPTMLHATRRPGCPRAAAAHGGARARRPGRRPARGPAAHPELH